MAVLTVAVDPTAEELFDALRDALEGDGPAVLPRSRDADAGATLPAEVPDGVVLAVETSGSTGAPKRVMLSRGALLASASASAAALGGHGQWLLALPTHYVAGAQVLVRSLAAGTRPVVMADGRFDAAGFLHAAVRMTGERRYVSLVPAQLVRLLDAAEGDRTHADALRRFDGILIGGQSLRADLAERAARLGLAITRTYGSSETAGGCVYDGMPLDGVRARVTDGEIELGGATIADGYLGDPERTAAVFRVADGTRWYRTSDLGTVAPDGRVSVTGRADNVIISGGEKVVLDLVERHVRAIPGLADAVVVAADSEQWGQVPVVFVAGDPVELGEVRARLASELGRAAAPSAILAVESLPMLASGKPDRRALADLAGRRP